MASGFTALAQQIGRHLLVFSRVTRCPYARERQLALIGQHLLTLGVKEGHGQKPCSAEPLVGAGKALEVQVANGAAGKSTKLKVHQLWSRQIQRRALEVGEVERGELFARKATFRCVHAAYLVLDPACVQSMHLISIMAFIDAKTAGMNIDPSALVALNMLLEERSVTRAAQRLGITQSSMSHRLARLRSELGDALFVRMGARLIPTPRALAMAEPLAEALRALNAAVAMPAVFDPRKVSAKACIVMPDLLAALAPALVSRVAELAPGVELRFVGVAGDLSSVLAGQELSLALVPARFAASDMQARAVGELRFGVAGRRGHPALARRLSLERWLAERQVVVNAGLERGSIIDEELHRRSLERRVGLVVPSFLAGLLSLTHSDLLMNVPVPLVDAAAKQLGLRVREAPLPLPSFRFSMVWHPRFQQDAAHRWLRELVFGCVQRTFVKQPSSGRRHGHRA